MTGRHWPAVTAVLLVATAVANAQSPPSSLVLPLHITRAAATTVASCTLIARDEQPDVVNLYFVSAARLFVASADVRPAPISAVVVDPARRRLMLRPDDVILPGGTLVDLALLRATAPRSDLLPQPLSLVTPAAGDTFIISGIGDNGGTVDVPQHVRFASTLFAIGDRDASQLVGCVGAAASTAAGTFGFVTGCEPRKAPTVTLLAAARAFLVRHIRSLQIGRHTS